MAGRATMADTASVTDNRSDVSHFEKMMDIYGTDRTAPWTERYSEAVYGWR